MSAIAPDPSRLEKTCGPFQRALQNYLRALQEAWEGQDVEQRGQEAHQNYWHVLHDAQMAAQKGFLEAYQNCTKVVQEASGSEDFAKRVNEAYEVYMRTMHQSQVETQKCFSDAHQNWIRTSQEIWRNEDFQKRAREAYQQYLRDLREAWAETDINTIEPPLLAAISQNMIVVAWTAFAIEQWWGQCWGK